MGTFKKFYTVDFTLLAITKRWINCNLFTNVIQKLVEAYKNEYCDLSQWDDESVAKIMVERWVEYNNQLNLFDLGKFIEYMSPSKSYMIRYGNEKLPYYSSCLRTIMGCVILVESNKLPGFHEWLIENKYWKEE